MRKIFSKKIELPIVRMATNLSKKKSRQGLYEFLHQTCDQIPSQAQVLCIGSGGEIGVELTKISQKKCFKVISIDVDPQRKPDVLGDICSYDFGDSTFDAVVMLEVLEHVHSPHLAIANVHRTLKTSGMFILSTPFLFLIHDSPHDYYRFTKYGLELLLFSFSSISIRERNSYLEAIDVMWLRLIKEDVNVLLSSILIIVSYYLKSPVTSLLNLFFLSFGATTGYVTIAIR